MNLLYDKSVFETKTMLLMLLLMDFKQHELLKLYLKEREEAIMNTVI